VLERACTRTPAACVFPSELNCQENAARVIRAWILSNLGGQADSARLEKVDHKRAARASGSRHLLTVCVYAVPWIILHVNFFLHPSLTFSGVKRKVTLA
jgi:hypothetical protein